ncbi:hypothetical protein M0813_01218 [Anaeramoeba flamelloides]|uniref:Stealth protein CR2 conserved region 2 domain-containing protein n=1 Tax=Anaeramoeba flamelloides TaxID=1746091 RepID=A0ABQ8ZCH0_9EUKA|nr:hypothetical protein M0813_01218 [Anaeramoeba flamelloides]
MLARLHKLNNPKKIVLVTFFFILVILIFKGKDFSFSEEEQLVIFTQTDLDETTLQLQGKKQIIDRAESELSQKRTDVLNKERENESQELETDEQKTKYQETKKEIYNAKQEIENKEFELEELLKVYNNEKKNLQIKTEIVQDEGKIDLVYSWAGILNDMTIRNRYNWELQFSLRAIHKYLPWINKIYILINTDTEPPYWLKENYPDGKIVILDRCELIDHPDYCPTYNSFAVYSVVHTIPGLSNKFILMDDDFFFNRPVGPEYMFTERGLPIVYQKFRKTPTYKSNDKLWNYIKTNGYPKWKYAKFTHIPMPLRRDLILKFDQNYPGYLDLVQSHYKKRYKKLTEEVSMIYYLYFSEKGWIKAPGQNKAKFFQTPKYHKDDITQEFETYYDIITGKKKITFNVNDSFSKNDEIYQKQRKVLWNFYNKLYPETPDYELPNPDHAKYS